MQLIKQLTNTPQQFEALSVLGWQLMAAYVQTFLPSKVRAAAFSASPFSLSCSPLVQRLTHAH